ncbi:MAG: hypothetical protein QOJ35_2321 [Solirubrobacteraceae bacterium]|nr:hypothetical protein [Solirubrobacteraceae bacterium]
MTLAVLLALWALPGRAQGAPAGPAPGDCAAANVVPTDPLLRRAAADAVLCLVNAERGQHGLAPVTASPLLGRAAAFHSSDMVRRKYFSHVTPSGQDVRRRVARTGYLRGSRCPVLGETLAWGSDAFASPSELVKGLMLSPMHRRIVLDRRFRDVGVGLALGAPMDGMGAQGSTLSLDFGRR